MTGTSPPRDPGTPGGPRAAVVALLRQVLHDLAGPLGGAATVWVLDDDGRTLVPLASAAADPEVERALESLHDRLRPQVGEGLAGGAVAAGAPLLIPRLDLEAIGRAVPAYAQFMRDWGVEGMTVHPLTVLDESVGAVGLVWPGRSAAAALDLVQQLPEVVARIAPAVETYRLIGRLEYLDSLVDQVSDAIVATDAEFRVTSWNRAAELLYGVPEAEALGRPLAELAAPLEYLEESEPGEFHLTDTAQAIDALRAHGEWSGRVRQRRPDGRAVLVEAHVRQLYDARGRATGAASVNRDITETAAAEEEQEARHRLTQAVLDASPAYTLLVTPDGTVSAVSEDSRGAAAALGMDLSPGRTLREALADLEQLPTGTQQVLDLLADVRSGRVERGDVDIDLIDPSGAPRSFHVQVAPLAEEPYGVVLAILDITHRRALERQLAHRAQHDALTGLPNRAHLELEVGRALSRAARRGTRVAVLFCDLDRFKDINDSYGHERGDSVLREVAGRIRSACRDHDLVARFGGDEFVVVAEDVDDEAGALALGQRVLGALRDPVRIGPVDAVLGLSVGAALSEGGSGPEAVDELLSEADAAMYRAKDEGRNRVTVFRAEMRERVRARLALASALRRAVEGDELELVYQPVVAMDGRVLQWEAFVRWRAPGQGLLRPDAFLDAAEESGAIVGVGAWVLDHAVTQTVAWGAALEGRPVAVNLSPRQLADPGLVDLVSDALDRSGLEPERLHLEITEDALLDDPEQAFAALSRLAAMGVGLVVDDFGTGLSSLAHLEELPVRMVKVDRRLTARVDRRPRAAALVRAVVALGHALQIPVVAEGVETREQLDAVAAAGCDGFQGYLATRPRAAEELPLPWRSPVGADG
ncbi:MAG: EAL domain-containing protein [Candidatus Nanopelagicales bacterium]